MTSVWSKTPVFSGSSQNMIVGPKMDREFSPQYVLNNQNYWHEESLRALWQPEEILAHDNQSNWNGSDLGCYRDGLGSSTVSFTDVQLKDSATQTDEKFMSLCTNAKHAYLEMLFLGAFPYNSEFSSINGPKTPLTPVSPTSDYNSPTDHRVFDFSPVKHKRLLSHDGPGSLKNVATEYATHFNENEFLPKMGRHLDTFCGFCYNNARVNGCAVDGYGRWLEHNLHDKDGRVTCPCLRMFECPICGASGDNAHTQRHCPKRNFAIKPPSRHSVSTAFLRRKC